MSVINRNSGSPIFNTLAEAQASNMNVGQLPIVLGSASAFDGGGIIYSVQPNGSGGIAMTNGNELIKYSGTAAVLDVTTSDDDKVSNRILRTENKWHTAQLGSFMTYGGTANAITLTAVNTTAVMSLSEGQKVRFRATATNTGATTINGDPCIDPQGNALTAGYIGTNADTSAVFDGTSWVVSEIEGQIGVNQTWQDLTGSRAAATEYTNTTGKPIYVCINIPMGATGGRSLTIDSTVVLTGTTIAGVVTPLTAIIPPNSTYEWDSTFERWLELR